jgi:hypothetical protein
MMQKLFDLRASSEDFRHNVVPISVVCAWDVQTFVIGIHDASVYNNCLQTIDRIIGQNCSPNADNIQQRKTFMERFIDPNSILFTLVDFGSCSVTRIFPTDVMCQRDV